MRFEACLKRCGGAGAEGGRVIFFLAKAQSRRDAGAEGGNSTQRHHKCKRRVWTMRFEGFKQRRWRRG
jgi:hypothetical protein